MLLDLLQKCTAYARQKGDFGILKAWPFSPLNPFVFTRSNQRPLNTKRMQRRRLSLKAYAIDLRFVGEYERTSFEFSDR